MREQTSKGGGAAGEEEDFFGDDKEIDIEAIIKKLKEGEEVEELTE